MPAEHAGAAARPFELSQGLSGRFLAPGARQEGLPWTRRRPHAQGRPPDIMAATGLASAIRVRDRLAELPDELAGRPGPAIALIGPGPPRRDREHHRSTLAAMASVVCAHGMA